VATLDTLIKKPHAEDIRGALKDFEKTVLERIDMLKKEDVNPLIITEDKQDEQVEKSEIVS
jgi:hypothetical protein